MVRPTPEVTAVPYSLVSAATLGFDLVRLPAGRAVAEVLLPGLSADIRTLAAVAAAHPARGLSREERGVRVVRSRRAREMAAGVPHVRGVAAGVTGSDRAALLVDSIADVVDVDASDFEAPPDTLEGQARDLIRGAYKLDGQLLLALDVQKAVSA